MNMGQTKKIDFKAFLARRRMGVQPEVVIRGDKASTVSPEGVHRCMKIKDLVKVVARSVGTRSTGLLPDGIREVTSRGKATLWVYERSPQVYNFRWIAPDSPAPYGKKATYRDIRIALPYLVVLAVFQLNDDNGLTLSGVNECFFRTGPLKHMNDSLFFPALLNCSRFNPPEGRPLSWICTANLNMDVNGALDEKEHMLEQFRILLHCLLETGFNLSSELHEGTSWYSESVHVDPRISTAERWEKSTREDPLFVLDVPWLPTGMTIRQVMERIFSNLAAQQTRISSATDISRIMFNFGKPSPRRPWEK